MDLPSRDGAAKAIALAAAIALALPAVRHGLEIDMARHMLLEFPAVVAIGAVAGGAAPRIGAAFGRYDRLGLTGWLLASLVLGYWMIPSTLDAALASPVVNAAKFISLGVAGFALRAAWQRSPTAVEAFFVGNFAWMAATVGLLYQDAQAQLCLNYLADGQQRAGRGLVAAAICAGVAWLVARRRRVGLADSPRRRYAD
jgi:hypothetical protein